MKMYYLFSVILKQNSILEGIEDALTVVEQIKRYGFLKSEFELAKKRHLDRLNQALTQESTRSSNDFIDEYINHFIYEEMITGLKKEIEYTLEIFKSISVEDLNEYFKNYLSSNNRIISILAPDSITDLPTEKNIENLFKTVSLKDIEPYEFELKNIELIKEDLNGSKIVKRKRFQEVI